MRQKGKLRKFVVTLLAVLLLVPGGFAAPVMAADPGIPETVTVYHETFEHGMGKAVQAGNPGIIHVTDKYFDGNEDGAALHLSDRNNNYDAIDLPFADIGLIDGKTYSVTVKGYVDENVTVPEGAQAFLQTVNSYAWHGSANFISGAAFTLSGDVTVDYSKDESIRIQSNEDGETVPFYIGEVIITTQNPIHQETFNKSDLNETLVIQAGNPKLDLVTGVVFDGNPDGFALSVTDRTYEYDGVDLLFSKLNLRDGYEYAVTASVYVNAGTAVPAGSELAILTVDDYRDWKSVELKAGEAVSLTQTFTIDSGSASAIRIQTNDIGKKVPFYIGRIVVQQLTEGGTVPSDPSEPFTPTEIARYNFDDGTEQGWEGRGGNATTSTEESYSGTHSLKVTGRTQNWHGAQISLADKILPGAEYEIKAFARLVSGEPDSPLKLTMHVGGEEYTEVTPETTVTDSGWTELKPTNPFKVDALGSSMTLYVESSNETVAFYVDDIVITQLTAAPKPDDKEPDTVVFDFEDGVQGWVARGGNTKVDVTNEAHFEGSQSLKVTDRSVDWHGAQRDVKSLLFRGAKYEISAFVKLVDAPASPSVVKISVARHFAGDEEEGYDTVAQASVDTADWYLLKGTYTFDQDPQSMVLYIESSNPADEFYIDSVTIKMTEAPKYNLLHDFEDGIGNWTRRFGDDGIEITNEDNHTEGGSFSLKTTAMQQYDGPLLDVRGHMHRGHQYELSAWVKMAQGESPTVLRISVQHGESSFANVSANAQVTDQAWVKLSGLYIQNTQPGDILNAYVEVANNYGETRTFLIDDFELKYVGPVAGPNPDFNLPSIQEVYKDYFPIGNIMNPGDFEEGVHLQMLQKHHTLLSAENFMKPEYAYKSNSRDFDLSSQIELVEDAIANGFDVHGHVLVWHAQSPDWLHTKVNESGTVVRDEAGNIVYLDADEALDNLRAHIETVVKEIGDRVISWDVVNEAMNDNPQNPTDWRNALRRSGWFHAIGPDYIYEAFKTAREVIDENGWDIELYYNDYNDDNQNKMIAITSMVKELNERYAEETGGRKLIDGIGMQAHYNLNTNPENVRASIERIIELDVKVGVTELDIMAGENGTQTEEEAIRQGYLYAQLFQLYKEYADHITRVTFWGVDDGNSWRTENSPLLFDRQYQAKPAYYAVIDPETFIEEHPPVEREYQQSTAAYGTPTIDGSEDDVWNNAAELPITRFQTAHNVATGVAKVLWDDENLYVLVKVNDTVLDDTAVEPHEQDSVEVFLDETNSKASSYGPGVGQYRVNYKNVASFNPASVSEGFESVTVVSATYTDYTVEMKIPFKTITPRNGLQIGFDVQINDAEDGSRQGVSIWNDLTGQGWQDPSVFGVLTLTGKPGSGGGGGISPSPAPAPEQSVGEDGTVTVKPPVTTENGRAKASLSSDNLQQALEQAAVDENGQKKLVIEIEAEEGTDAVDVELPKASLASEEVYVVSLKTPQGTIDVPSNMLDGLDVDAETVTIAVAKAELEGLDEEVRSQIGNRPAISLNVLADGEVVAWNNPQAPVTVAIPYEPTEEELANPDHIIVWYIDGEGNAVAVPNGRYDADTGTVVFRTTHFSTFAVNYVVKSFTDLASVPWAKSAIEAMASRDVIAGVNTIQFGPDINIKRADFVALLVRALELQDIGEDIAMFDDVKETYYFYNEVKIAKQLGIANGTGDNHFSPNSFISRQDMMVLADLAMQAAGKALQTQEDALDSFPDADDVANYAKASAAKLVANGIVSGTDGKLAPLDQLTRAQAAVILYQLWSK